LSCSDDENIQKCQETNITVSINGELLTFDAISRGIVLTSKGYELTLGFYRRDEVPLREQNILITLRYKKTGKNIIENLFYTQYQNSIYFEGNIAQEELQSDVTKNTRSCFSTALSGSLNDGTQDIMIESVNFSYLYDEPFDE
jgi:hypothetical protein